MSLIHDALNKTDQYLERFVVSKPVTSQPATSARNHEPELKRLEKEIKKIEAPKLSRKSLLIVLAGLLALIWISRLFAPAPAEKSKIIEETKPIPVSAVIKPESVVVQSAPSIFKRSTSKAKYLLTGITSSDNVLLAVINDQVVGVGDTLREGATVTKITVDRVILDTDGQKTVLTF